MLKEITGIFEEPEKRIFEINGDEYILIEIEGDAEVYLIDPPTYQYEKIQKIGAFEFSPIEEPRGHEVITYYKVVHMDISEGGGRFLRKGIGTEVVKMKEELDGPVVFGSACGFSSDDGSHLIGDGPAFAAAITKNKKVRSKDEGRVQ